MSTDNCCIMLSNVTYYIDLLTTDTTGTTSTLTWTTILSQLDALFRKIQLTISSFENINLIFKLMIIILKIPGIISTKVKLHINVKCILKYYNVNCIIIMSY